MIDEQALRRFVSADGRIMAIPTKHSTRLELFDWLAQDFELGIRYPDTNALVFQSTTEALEWARTEWGASDDRWVNGGLVDAEYAAAKGWDS